MRKTKEKAMDKGKWPGHEGSHRKGSAVEVLGLDDDAAAPTTSYKHL